MALLLVLEANAAALCQVRNNIQCRAGEGVPLALALAKVALEKEGIG